jgi:hypothetical protein
MKLILLFVGVVAVVLNVPAADKDESSDNPNVLKELDSGKAAASSVKSSTGHVAKARSSAGKDEAPPPSIPATTTNLTKSAAKARPSTAASASKEEAPPPSIPATATNLATISGETAVQATRTPPKPLDLKGKVEKLDTTAGTLTVDGKAFVLSPKGRVYIDNVKKSLADLKTGDMVAVTYWEKEDGTLKATQIIKGFPRKKKKKYSSSAGN